MLSLKRSMAAQRCQRSLLRLTSSVIVVACICCYGLLIHVYLPTDVDECVRSLHSCHPNAKCINMQNSYECKCKNGYYGTGWVCHDLDECTQLKMPCWQNSRCVNEQGSYFCECLPGFKQNGTYCQDLDECQSNPCSKDADCFNSLGSFKCTCRPEYEGDGFSCIYSKKECTVPMNQNFPKCAEKVNWMKLFWKSHPCYARNGADGTLCSFLIYLSEVEHHCPLLPGRSSKVRKSKTDVGKGPYKRDNLSELFRVVRAENNFKWIRDRITSMWSDWLAAMRSLSSKQNLGNRSRKKVLIFVGALADQTWAWAEHAKRGGPLGELVQWADLIAALFVLGHDLYVSANVRELLTSSGAGTNPCGDDAIGLTEFDLIYIDIHGLHLLRKSGFDVNTLKCKYRVLDSFGTEARFNYMEDLEDSKISFNDASSNPQVHDLKKNPYGYGNWKLHLNQFMTMFPHSPDNSFLGFVVGKETSPAVNMTSKQNIALVYGKQNYMWREKSLYLSEISKFVKIHGTVTVDAPGQQQKEEKNQHHNKLGLGNVPAFIENHGLMEWNKLQKFLESVKIFVGLGFPFEGPAPLEAISKGCVFINPEFSPGLNRLNDVRIGKKLFFEGKPTLRKLKSQHPYLDQFVGKPHVWTVNAQDPEAVSKAILEILEMFKNGQVKPYLPYEFTHEGLLQRLNAYVSYQDFCDNKSQWPPTSALRIRVGNKGESCADRCRQDGLICENALFNFVNSEVRMKASGLECKTTSKKRSLLAPYEVAEECVLQGEAMAYSCVDAADGFRRLCPCRDYRKGQAALCSEC